MTEQRFSKDHEYARPEGDEMVVGITIYAQEQLGDIVFVDLPDIGKAVKAGDEVAVVESVKAASEIYSPVSGTITAVNTALAGEPGLVNSDPQGEGWIYRIAPTDPAEYDALLDLDAYVELTV